jgi:hypothetical protein
VRGSVLFVLILKFPLSSVKVPASVPLISTETDGTISFVDEFFTVPERTVFCENADETKMVRQASIPIVSV